MSREYIGLQEAAAHVHIEANELKHAAQRGEVTAVETNGDWRFERRALDEWAQRNLLAAGRRALQSQHQSMVDEHRRADRPVWRVAELIHEETVDVSVRAKAKAGILRDMTDLADRGGKGVALLHPRFHDPYVFEESFVAYGRSDRPVFFGASDGEGTRHFFLVCSADPASHLKILSRLAVLAHGTDLVARLDAAEDAAAVVAAVRACEEEFLD